MIKICTKCGESKTLDSFHKLSSSKDGRRPDCKDCCKRQRDEKANSDVVRAKAKIMSNGIMKRVKYNIDDPKNKCYKDNKVESKIGSTSKEIEDFLYQNFYDEIKLIIDSGKTPSVDRIDSQGHYEEGNIRIIDLKINTGYGVTHAIKKTSKPVKAIKDGTFHIFSSVSEASRELGIKRDTILAHMDKDTVTRAGYKFETIKETKL